ncbi:unnamed protein product [Rotaria sordida]|uniref:MYCBP-associated protein n=1 Tax=Rotaria sordida TaxID=392033 RepID=A0A814MQK0_9BILA|nr:unnamed protein product [Rotaria sordida]CAF1338063.1 unnamed protein product [Rotaria sordida]
MSTALGQRKPEKLEKGKEKGKAGGKGTKTVSPILDGPIESDTSRPLDSEEIQALAIRYDELEKLHQDKNGKKLTEQQKSFIVKKTKTGPQKQPIQVAKIAPQQPVQEQLISSGIRFDSSGNVLSYSILGTINDYVTELPDIEAAELCTTGNDKKTAEDIPEIGTYDKKTKQGTGSPDGGTRALKNWKFRMDERRQVMKNMSKGLKRSPATLLMNQTDRWRERKELLELMDATLPLLQNGKNWRLNSEFWTQQQLIGNDDTGIHTTLTRTETGCPPSFETIGKPSLGLLETGIDLTNQNPEISNKRQWFNSEYLEKRLNQLNPYMEEIVPYKADLSSLQIIGYNSTRRKSQQKNNIEVHLCEKINEKDKEYEIEPTDNIQTNDNDDDDKENENIGDTFNDIPDIVDATIMGPALKIDTFIFQQMPYINENEELDFIYEIRVQFDSQVNQSVTRMVEIKNVGTTVFYYEWQQKPYTKPFDIVNSKIQRFYFDNRTSSILPNDTLKLSFVFKSSEPGIFTERWQLLTRPVLCGGRPIIFTLRGVTIEEDIHRQTRINIDKMLLHKEAESIVRKVVSNILDNVRTPERARSPVGFYMTEQEQFQQNNPDLYFDYEIVEQIKKLYEQVVPEYEEQKWNLSIDTLRDKILSFDEDNPNKQIFLEQLNQAIHQLTLQPILPSEQTTYLVCYDIMNQFVDSFVDQMVIVHQKLQIDEPSSESYPDIDLNGYEFESWKKFFEYTKQQENEKRLKSAVGGATKDKKAPPPSKLERGKSPKRSPAPSQAPSAVGKRGTVSGSISQMSKRPSFISPAKPDKERFQLTPQQLDERFKLTQQAYLPIYSLLCHTFDRLEQALDDLSEKSPSNNENTLYTQLATTIQNQSLNVLDILKDELTRNVTSIDVNSFF